MKNILTKNNLIKALFLLLTLSFASCTKTAVTVNDLQCEYLSNPLGIDVQKPRFSWKLESTERAVNQQSYQILVSTDEEALENNIGDIWDTGIIDSDKTFNIEYEGRDLKSNQKYFWKVGVKTNADNKISWSKTGFFHIGLSPGDWKAKWLTTKEEIKDNSPIFRKSFSINKEIKEAYVYATSAGFYELYLNGQKVGGHVLDPAVTDYPKRVLYSTFDVGDQLKSGENALGLMLGNGAYNLRIKEGRYSWMDAKSLGNPRFIVQLIVEYTDGAKDIIVSDNSWKYTDGLITFNNIYGGEDYDASKEITGWADAGFDASNWLDAVIVDGPGGELSSQMMPAIKVTQTLKPVATTFQDGVYLFDLGQNIAGWWKIKLKGKVGQTIRIRGAETLNNDKFPKKLEEGDVLSERQLFHSQSWTDYTLKGGDLEEYEPRFFYTGFRYVELTTMDKSELHELQVEGRVVRTALEDNGKFTASNELLNQIHEAAVWSQKANTVGYPTDCPHREKGAYNGDGQVIAETSMHDFQMAPFYRKWLNDMRDAQYENGWIPNTSPTLIGGMGGGVAWGSAYVLIPWWMYNYYGDTRILKEHYSSMKKYLAYLVELGKTDANPKEDLIINDFQSYWYSLGEWCSPGRSDCPNHPVVNTFYFYNNAKLLSQIAGVLGEKEDAGYYHSLSKKIKVAFNEKFFNADNYLYGTDSTYQTYQVLALHGDVVKEEYKDQVFKTITDDVKARNGHLNTGIMGTKYLWSTLLERGRNDLAYQIATQKTYPSYGYWIENNFTTLGEFWSGEKSQNHQMFGTVGEYFYKYLSGIQSPMEERTSQAYKHIHLQPVIPNDLKSAGAEINTVSGKIQSEWVKTDSSLVYQVSVPVNTTATVVLPTNDFTNYSVSEGDVIIWEDGQSTSGVSGIKNIKKQTDNFVVEIGSGAYCFTICSR